MLHAGAGTLDQPEFLLALGRSEREDQPATDRQLVEQRRRRLSGDGADMDGVERGAFHPTGGAIAMADRDGEGAQPGGGGGGQGGEALDRPIGRAPSA